MHITMPRPIIKCSKCGSVDIVIPERSANGPSHDDGSTLLRCRGCGHEKLSGHKQRFDEVLKGAVMGTRPMPTEETF
jgi:uncharacterized Zn finger protein